MATTAVTALSSNHLRKILPTLQYYLALPMHSNNLVNNLLHMNLLIQ